MPVAEAPIILFSEVTPIEAAGLPSLSVIVPVYNCGDTLERCLHSIQRQSRENFEVLLIDDGSTDQSGEIMRRFAREDSRFTILSQPNAGAAAARNAGLRAACGELVQFVDADDLLDPDFLSIMLPLMAGCDCAVCGYRRMTEAGREIERFEVAPRVISGSQDWAEAFDAFYRRYLLSSVCNKLYRRELIAELGLAMDTTLPIGEDLVFNLSYLAHCRTISVTDRMLYRYLHRGSASLTGVYLQQKPQIDRRLYDEALAFCVRMGIPPAPSISVIYLKSCFTSIEKLIYPRCSLPRAEIDRELDAILAANQTALALATPLPDSREARLYQMLLRTRSKPLLKLCARIRGWLKAMLQR